MNIPKKRLVAVITGSGEGELREYAMPEIGKGSILIKCACSMISSGTHLGNVKQQRLNKTDNEDEPKIFGYQSAGTVVKTGSDVAKLQPGDRVCCYGGEAVHSNWVVVPQNLCEKLPDSIDYEDASGVNLVLTSIQALRRAKPEFGEKMLVVGMGVVGQIIAQAGISSGLDVMAWDLASMRLDTVAKQGVSVCNVLENNAVEAGLEFTKGSGFDIAIMAMGGNGTEVLRQVSDVMMKYPDGHKVGRIVIPGGMETLCKWGAQGLDNIDLRCSARTGPGYKDEQWELGEVEYPKSLVRWTSKTNLEMALQWIESGRLDIKSLLTHKFPLAEVEKAVNVLIDDPEQAIGVVLTMD